MLNIPDNNPTPEQEGIPQPFRNRRVDVRTTNATLLQVPLLVRPEHQAQAEHLRVIIWLAVGRLRAYIKNPLHINNITKAIEGFSEALVIMKSWSDDELIALYGKSDPSRKQKGPRVLGTILGDMITAFGIYYEKLDKDRQDQTAQKETARNALVEIVGLLETAQREETMKLTAAKGPGNQREEIRMTKVPLIFWQIMGLDYEINGKSFHALWESIVARTQEFRAQTQYLDRLEEEESSLKSAGEGAQYAQGSARARVTARRYTLAAEINNARKDYKKTRDALMQHISTLAEEFEKLPSFKLQELKQTGLLGGVIGDIITIASSIRNDLHKPDREDKYKEKHVQLILAKAAKILRLATFSDSARVREISTIVEELARQAIEEVNPNRPMR